MRRLLLTLTLIALAGCESTVESAVESGDTEALLAALEELDGVTRDVDGQVTKLNFTGTRISDAGLEHLKGLTNLESLNLKGTQITSSGFWKLKKSLPNWQ